MFFWITQKGDVGLAGRADKPGGFPSSPMARGAGQQEAGSDYTHEVIAAGMNILGTTCTAAHSASVLHSPGLEKV